MVVCKSPYRAGTKMAAVFYLFNDGQGHTLNEVAPLVTIVSNQVTPRIRRTAGSFVRTLRRKFKVVMNKLDHTEYTLTGPKES